MLNLSYTRKYIKSFHLFLSESRKSNLRFLFIYIGINLLYSLFLNYNQGYIKGGWLNSIISNFPISYITAPIIYFYCRDEICQFERFKFVDIYHFLPLLLYIIYVYATNFEISRLNFTPKANFEIHSISSSPFLLLIRILQIFVYFFLGLIICYKRFGFNFIKESRISVLSPYLFIYVTIVSLAFYPQIYFWILNYFDVKYNFVFSVSIVFLTGIVIRIFVWRYPVIINSVNNIIQAEAEFGTKEKREILLSSHQ